MQMTIPEDYKIIPPCELPNYPFNYKYLLRNSIQNKRDQLLSRKIGNMRSIQNENSYLKSFYKNISRF